MNWHQDTKRIRLAAKPNACIPRVRHCGRFQQTRDNQRIKQGHAGAQRFPLLLSGRRIQCAESKHGQPNQRPDDDRLPDGQTPAFNCPGAEQRAYQRQEDENIGGRLVDRHRKQA